MTLKVAEPGMLRKVTNVVVYTLDLTLPISFRRWKGVLSEHTTLYASCISCTYLVYVLISNLLCVLQRWVCCRDSSWWCHRSLCQCSWTSSKLPARFWSLEIKDSGMWTSIVISANPDWGLPIASDTIEVKVSKLHIINHPSTYNTLSMIHSLLLKLVNQTALKKFLHWL